MTEMDNSEILSTSEHNINPMLMNSNDYQRGKKADVQSRGEVFISNEDGMSIVSDIVYL